MCHVSSPCLGNASSPVSRPPPPCLGDTGSPLRRVLLESLVNGECRRSLLLRDSPLHTCSSLSSFCCPLSTANCHLSYLFKCVYTCSTLSSFNCLRALLKRPISCRLAFARELPSSSAGPLSPSLSSGPLPRLDCSFFPRHLTTGSGAGTEGIAAATVAHFEATVARYAATGANFATTVARSPPVALVLARVRMRGLFGRSDALVSRLFGNKRLFRACLETSATVKRHSRACLETSATVALVWARGRGLSRWIRAKRIYRLFIEFSPPLCFFHMIIDQT